MLLGPILLALQAVNSQPNAQLQPSFSIRLDPQPAYASDATNTGDSLLVADRGDSALTLFSPSGKQAARYDGSKPGRGQLVGHVRIAADGATAYAWANRHALLALSLPRLDLLSETPTSLARDAGRMLRSSSGFLLNGAMKNGDGIDFIWSEPDPPGTEHQGYRRLWSLPTLRLAAFSFVPLICRLPDQRVAAIRFDKYELGLLKDEVLTIVPLQAPASFRPRADDLPAFGPGQQAAFVAWAGTASSLNGLICLDSAVAVLRADGSGSKKAWSLDVYGVDGKSQGTFTIPTHAGRIVPLGSRCSRCVEFLEIESETLEIGTGHTWTRYVIPR